MSSARYFHECDPRLADIQPWPPASSILVYDGDSAKHVAELVRQNIALKAEASTLANLLDERSDWHRPDLDDETA